MTDQQMTNMDALTAIHTPHEYTIDLNAGPLEAEIAFPLCHQDAHADTFVLHVRRGFQPADLTGMTVTAYMTFAEARKTLPIAGVAEDCRASVTLPAECYAFPGRITLTIQLICGEARHTLARLSGAITRTAEDQLISSGELLPSLPELLEQIADMQTATAEAREVVNGISSAVSDASQAAADAKQAVSEAEAAVQAVDGMTVSAQAGETADAQISEQNGVKHIHLTLPRGQDGNDGVGIASIQCRSSSQSGGTGTIAITLTNGETKTLEVVNGKDGQDGADGHDGKTPVRGVDYFTAADRAAMINDVTAGLPIFTLTGTDANGTEHVWTLYGKAAGA